MNNLWKNSLRGNPLFPRIARTSVIDSPTLLESYYLVLPRKFYSIRNLCILVHFIPNDSIKWRLRLDLEEKIGNFDLKKQLELKLLIESKQNCLTFLYETSKYTSNEVFGNILNQSIKDFESIKFLKKSSRVNKAQRRRGYNDKGSLRPREKWIESYDFSFTELQNEKEKKTNLHNKTLHYLNKYLKEKYLILIK